jgi:copper chaperone NosL
MQKLLLRTTLILFGCLWIAACDISPSAIEYGADQCHACKMTISNHRFGAELVTTKGKVYKYDAIECLVPVVRQNGEDHYAYILVTDCDTPGNLMDARSSTFLISENLPSPMGGNLSAYSSQEAAAEALATYGGEVFSWEALKNRK